LKSILSSVSLGVLPLYVLYQRGVRSVEGAAAYLDPRVYSPTLSDKLPGVLRAVGLLRGALVAQSRVLLWVDFDVDGLAAAAVLFGVLRGVGLGVQVYVGGRRGGVDAELGLLLSELGSGLLVACDIGASFFFLSDYAKYPGVKSIVADHHYLPETLPSVDALVNPQLLPEQHPLRNFTGVGVAFLLAQQFCYEQKQEHLLTPLLDLLPLGLIGDAANLVDDVRYWVQRGLEQLRTSPRPGLQALATQMQVDLPHVTAEDIAFRLVPPLNAFARFGKAEDGFRLLVTQDAKEASLLALQAAALNQKRQHITRQMIEAAHAQIEKDPSLLNWAALVLANPSWEPAMLGAVAGELAAEYQKPAVLFVPDGTGNATGSARSPGGFNLMTALAEVDKLLIRYGGHQGAAGLSLHIDHLPLFRRQFSNALADQQPHREPNTLVIEAILPFDQVTLQLAHELEPLAPFGNGNPRPVIMTPNLTRVRSAKFGHADQHRRLTLQDENGIQREVLWWNGGDETLPDGVFNVAYRIAPVYRDGAYELQISLVDWQQVQAPEITAPPKPDLIDCRKELDLVAIRSQEPSLMIWAEGYSQSQSPGVPLSELNEAEALVIYTAPPHPDRLEKALRTVQPKRVYVFAELPPFDHPQRLAEAVVALLRVAQQQFAGRLKLSQLAERTAHHPQTIRLSLEALEAHINIEWLSQSSFRVIRVDQPPPIDHSGLARAIEETAAYRRFLRRVEIDGFPL
jgi:single-stranded-DNA-specific exonuclease